MPQKLHQILNMTAVLSSKANGFHKVIEEDRLQEVRCMLASHQLLQMQQLKNCSDHRLSHIGRLEPHTIAKATTSIDTSSEWDIRSPIY